MWKVLFCLIFIQVAVFRPSSVKADTRLNYVGVSEEILRVAEQNDITVFGENHGLRDARRILMLLLKRGFDSGIIRGFSTEYIIEETEPDFQEYLSDPIATQGSPAEEQFFKKISDLGYVFIQDELNKDFYRFLRVEKQKRPSLKICGLDVRSSENKDIRAERFNSFPVELLRAAERFFRLDLQGMIDAVDMNYDREPMMALRAYRCLVGAGKSVVHMGAAHSWSLRYDPRNYEAQDRRNQPGWAAASHFLKVLLPNANIKTIVTAQPLGLASGQLDGMDSAFYAAYMAYHNIDPSRVSLVGAQEMSPQLRQILLVRRGSISIPLSEVWDYFILGPEGEPTSF